jgi:hypothetical protein
MLNNFNMRTFRDLVVFIYFSFKHLFYNNNKKHINMISTPSSPTFSFICYTLLLQAEAPSVDRSMLGVSILILLIN